MTHQSDIFNRGYSWYPGHMEKSRKKIIEHFSLVDHALYLLDARCPLTCINKTFLSSLPSQHRDKISFVMNKSDLSPEKITRSFVRSFKDNGYALFPTVSDKGKPGKRLAHFLKQKQHHVALEMKSKGRLPRSIRVMILGIPNVGKSTLLNQFCGKRQAITGQKAGVTRGLQWVKSRSGIDFMDTPGVLFPRIKTLRDLAKLVFIGSVRKEALTQVNLEDLLECLLPDLLKDATFVEKVDPKSQYLESPPRANSFLRHVAKRFGFLASGNEYDTERALEFIMTKMLKGELGKHCYDEPAETSQTLNPHC